MGRLLSPFATRGYPPPIAERLILGDDIVARKGRRAMVQKCTAQMGKFDYLRVNVCVTRSSGRLGDVPVNDAASAVRAVSSVYPDMLDAIEERVVLLVLNARLIPVAAAEVSRGASDASIVPLKEILRLVLLTAGHRFLLFHNHPAENSTPSDIDSAATDHLVLAAKAVGLEFIDHIVVARGNWTSIRTGQRGHAA